MQNKKIQKVLFVRDFRPKSNGHIRISGGHIKIRDYFMHCLEHPALDPYLYFTPKSAIENSELWEQVPRERIIRQPERIDPEIFFLTGKDLKHLPRNLVRKKKRINFMQTLRACSPDHPVYPYVIKPAYRIFVSPDIFEAGRNFPTIGAPFVIPNGIPLQDFKPGQKEQNSILIWAKKHPEIGAKIHESLRKLGYDSELLTDYVPRAEFARKLGQTDIFVTCPWIRESFHLPSIEGMASGCAVVTSDNVGNRSFCIHRETCMMTEFGRVDQYVEMITLLFQNPELKKKIQQNGLRKAAYYSLERERQDYFRFVETNLL